jgi:hypothetical protein
VKLFGNSTFYDHYRKKEEKEPNHSIFDVNEIHSHGVNNPLVEIEVDKVCLDFEFELKRHLKGHQQQFQKAFVFFF